jgi:CHAT domain-containing protein
LLAVGGVRYNADLSRVAKVRGYGDQLSNLPGSQEEADAASEVLGPSLKNSLELDNEFATEAAVKNALKQDREVVHLAVHGLSNSKEDPELAALVFLQDKKAGEDGMLEVPEIVRLHLRSDLVVLSACDTAVGELEGEEGVSNLSRSFLLAGAGSVTSTLWSVDDVFSATLMKHFYDALAKGESKADALEDAQRYVLKQFSGTAVPWYWAGYVMEGDATTPLPTFQTKVSAGFVKRAHAEYALVLHGPAVSNPAQ